MTKAMAILWRVLLVGVLMTAGAVSARDCRSELGAHLKPLLDSRLSWAVEASGNLGWMSGTDVDRTLWTGMFLWGLDYQLAADSPHRLYLEAGVKDWYRSDERPGSGGEGGDRMSAMGFGHPEKRHLGPREAYYQYDGAVSTLTAGLQSMHLGDYLLLDERVLGAKWVRRRGPLEIVLLSGTVATDFARMEDFCASRHTYRLVRSGRFDQVSSDLWETNLAGGMISWSPGKASGSDTPVADETPGMLAEDLGGLAADPSETAGELADDEFLFTEIGDEFASLDGESTRHLQRAAFVFLEEFGDAFHEYKYYYGGLAEWALGAGVDLQTEILVQHIQREMALGFLTMATRDVTWASGAFTELKAGYMGKVEIDSGALFYPAFSNLFQGEVMRLDAVDFPFLYLRARHVFPGRMKPSVSCLLVAQTQNDDTREVDMEVGLRIFRGLRWYGIASRVTSDLVTGTETLGRGEFRWAF